MSNFKKDTVMCKVSTSSLFSSALVWLNKLPPHLVNSFSLLVQSFINQFFTSIKQQKQTKDLFLVIQ